jgi:polysaccharide export outer membrane protein
LGSWWEIGPTARALGRPGAQKDKLEAEDFNYMNHWFGRVLRNRKYFFFIVFVTLVISLSLFAAAQQGAESAKLVPAKDTAATVAPVAESKPEPDVKAASELKPEYVVGEGDALHIDVWQEPEVSQNVVVRPDGKVSLPLVNEVKVSGMTPLQIQAVVAEKLKTFVNQPKVTVTVIEVHSRKAFITGEVAHPGEYPLNTQVTVLQLIAQSGGFTPFAKTENIMILRVSDGKEQRLKFKYKEVLRGKNTDQNIALEPGDTVVVP